MDIDFSKISEHQRYKVMHVSSIHAGYSPVSAPQECMQTQYSDPHSAVVAGAFAERYRDSAALAPDPRKE